jgi:hypothetical protein
MRGFEVLCHVGVSTANPKMKDREEDSVLECVERGGPFRVARRRYRAWCVYCSGASDGRTVHIGFDNARVLQLYLCKCRRVFARGRRPLSTRSLRSQTPRRVAEEFLEVLMSRSQVASPSPLGK